MQLMLPKSYQSILFANVFAVVGMITTMSVAFGGESLQNSIFSNTQPDNRYGLFNLLDHRSGYGQDLFPETFLVDDSDLETDEFRMDWLHAQGVNHQSSELMTAEVEKSFGIVTFELEVPFERVSAPGQTLQGLANVNLGARCPIYEFVSKGGWINTTFGTALEVGIPTNSSVSKNTELVPKVFNDLMIGKHFTLQTVLGYSMLYGSGNDGGLQTFEYGFVFGYTISHKELSLPGVMKLTPVFELNGQTQINKDAPRHNSLTGDIGIRCNFKPIGLIQPRPGIAFVFPIDNGAREQMHCGVVASLVFEY